MNDHIRSEHPEKEDVYQELVEVWRERCGSQPTEESIIQSYKEIYNLIIGQSPTPPKRGDFDDLDSEEIHEFLRELGY